MQIFPLESKGVEIVPARVAFSTDQKLNFEEYYKKQAIKDQKALSKAGAGELELFGNIN